MAVLLIRHGSAGVRNSNDPHDIERHLDEAGKRQAQRIATALEGTRFDAFFSSNAPRCVETIEPLSRANNCCITTCTEMTEGSDIEVSWTFLELVSQQYENVVLCSHGDVIPEIISRARGRGMAVPGKSGCAKGSIWQLHFEDDRIAWGTYTPIPN